MDTQLSSLSINDPFHSGSTTPSTTESSSPAPGTHKPTSTSTSVGAIAGGVVGGLAAICLLAALLFWLLRHRRRRRPQSPSPHQNEMADTSAPHKTELSGWERRREAEGGKLAWEIDGAQRMELDGTQSRELSGIPRLRFWPILIKASLAEEYELLPGPGRAAAMLTRLMMVPSAPKVWMKDCVVIKVPLIFVSYCQAFHQMRFSSVQDEMVWKASYISAPPRFQRNVTNEALCHRSCRVDQDMSFAEFGLDFGEE